MFTVRRALVSVSDKSDLIPFVSGLAKLGVEILSTGGTARQLREAGIDAIDVSDKTGFPEIMDGRVKTLHPTIHGGLLGRRGTDEGVMAEHGIEPIDMLVVNLYPFEQTIAREDATIDDAIESIDIGGPAMIRAASKNHDGVVVVIDPADYDSVLEKLEGDTLSLEERRRLAAKAYAHTAAYDTAITKYLSRSLGDDPLGERFLHAGSLVEKMRYGENPHQDAAFYIDQQAPAGSLATARQLQGKALSYNNIADSDAALECVRQFEAPACVIVKHANPCGVAVADDILGAYEKAFSTDPTSAFGGIIAFNRPLDANTAKAIIDRQFVEVIVAPSIDDDAATVTAAASSSIDGATITSTNCRSMIACAVFASSGRLNAMIPPNAEVGSVLKAFSYAPSMSSAMATPQGFACLTMTQAGASNCLTHSSAASLSAMLL